MKKSQSLFVAFFIIGQLCAQVPQAFNYQAVVRDHNGQILAEQSVGIRLSLVAGEPLGPIVYSESHHITTNQFGLVNIAVGNGKVEAGAFKQVDWSRSPYLIKIELDVKGGNNYKEMGTSQIMSVPYALYAETSGDSYRGNTEWTNDGTNIFCDETIFPGSNVGIGTTIPTSKLGIYGTGFSNPNEPMFSVLHQSGFSSTFRRYQNIPANALFLLQKSRGTMGAPLAVIDGDNIGQVRMEGYDGSEYKTAGWLRIAVDGNPSTGIVPGALLFATTDNTGNVYERMRINSEGKVGIGTTAPTQLLSVYGGELVLQTDNNFKDQSIIFQNPGGLYTWRIYRTHVSGIMTNLSIAGGLTTDYSALSDKVTITHNGNVGLGTTSPGGILDIAGEYHFPDTDGTSGQVLHTDGSGDLNWEDPYVAMLNYFSCIDYDGNAYPTTQIGTQVWMAENLRVTHYRNGDSIPNVMDDEAWSGLTSGAYCWYQNDKSTYEKYGVFYNWYTVDDSRGLCPYGWHVPSDAEWTILTTYLGGTEVAGGKMKSTGGFWQSPNVDATNSSNFSGIYTGHRNSDGEFQQAHATLWWSTTEFS